MIILFMVLILCEDKCSIGSSMCSNNMLSICDENGHWVTTDCPDDTECNTKNNSMACIPNTKEKGKNSKIDDSKMMEQLLKLTKDKEFVKRLKDELLKDKEEVIDSENEDETEETNSDNKEEEHISNQDEDYESEDGKKQKTHFKIKDKSLSNKKPSKKENSPIKKVNKQKQDKKGRPNKSKNIVKVVKGDHPKKSKSKDNNEEMKEEPQKVKTITYHKMDQTDKNPVTITVYKTIIQKDNEDENNQKKKNDKDLKSSIEAFKYQIPGTAKVNINLFTRPREEDKNIFSDQKAFNGQKSYGKGNQQQPFINESQKPAGGGAQKPSGNNAQKQAGGGAQKPTENGTQKPAGNNAKKPTENGAQKPTENGTQKPAGNNAQKPAGGGAQKPAGNNAQKPSGNNAQKPAGNNAQKPSGNNAQKPAGGGAQKPTENGAQKPAGGAQKPTENGTQKPAGGTSSKEKKSSTDKKDSTSQDKSSKTGSNSSASQNKSSGGGTLNITSDQINEAIGKVGYTSKPEYVDAVVKITNEEFNDINMAAMFLAQLAHESGGFQHMEEVDCAGSTKCADQYGGSEGAPGKSYHGRGFIQLSWPANYKEAGEGLGMGDQLFENPDMILEDPELGAKVSVWFWKTKVEPAPGVSEYKFGATTKAINGALECTGSNIEQSKKRYEFYKAIAEVLGVTDLASEEGCY